VTYRNGYVPLTALTRVAYSPRHLAAAGAARAITAASARFRRDFGVDIRITDAYRTYAEQVLVRAVKGALAAPPGTSNHGWGLAFDLASGINLRSSPEHAWMQRHAWRFGLDNPDWATPGTASFQKNEPWHWEYSNPDRDGSRAVVELQTKLGYARLLTGTADGYWWTATETAWDALMQQLAAGRAPLGRVKWLQRILARPYAGRLYTLDIDGIAGAGTLSAAARFHARFSGIK